MDFDIPSIARWEGTVNITTYVTTVLASVDDYLAWEMQFMSFVIMHQLHGTLDSTIIPLSPTDLVACGVNEPNLAYSY